MKRLVTILLITCFVSPAFAGRTDMMSSYGFGNKSQKYTAEKKYKKSRYRSHKYGNSDIYMGMQDRYIGDRYRSEAGRMLYENEHYKNYVDRNRYLKELREIDLEQRRLKSGKPQK
jgi:hypothetical protein